MCIRDSYYNTDGDVVHALDEITDILATRAHERWLGATARF